MKNVSSIKFYAIHVKTNHEDSIKKKLATRIDDLAKIYIMKKKIVYTNNGKHNVVTENIFPGYIVIEAEMTDYLKNKINEINNVYRILGDSFEISPIPISEMKPFLDLMDKDNVIDLSKGYKEGNRVNIVAGPLLGYEAIIKKVIPKKQRAIIELNFGGVLKTISIGLTILKNNA